MTQPRLPIRDCLGCPQNDDHPRLTYGDREVVLANDVYRKVPNYWHYDCAPPEVIDAVCAVLPESEAALLRQIIAHSVGTDAEHFHGSDLRDKVLELRAATPLPEVSDSDG